MYFTFASTYDAVSDVVRSGVQWRSNFQIGSRVLKIVRNLFLCISMAYNVISCIEVAEITQTLKIADFTAAAHCIECIFVNLGKLVTMRYFPAKIRFYHSSSFRWREVMNNMKLVSEKSQHFLVSHMTLECWNQLILSSIYLHWRFSSPPLSVIVC